MPMRVRWSTRVLDWTRPGVLLTLVLAFLAVGACADRVTHRKRVGSTDRQLDRKAALVTHVADGDTIDVDFDDPAPPVRVRLLGIDSPELDTTFGPSAKQYTKARCEGIRVTIRLEDLGGTRDKYGRLLAYVYLPNHELLNNSLIRDGQAFAYRVKKCDFSSQFEASENSARGAKRGMWKTITFDEMPEWRKRWMKDRGIR